MGEHRNGVVNQIGFTQTFTTDQDYGISHGACRTPAHMAPVRSLRL